MSAANPCTAPVARSCARSVLARRGGSTLPRLRPGEYFLTDENGKYLIDENGNYLIGKDS